MLNMSAFEKNCQENRGFRARLSRALGLHPSAVYQWHRVPARRVLDVERVTGIPRHELRPDIYPPQDARAEAAE